MSEDKLSCPIPLEPGIKGFCEKEGCGWFESISSECSIKVLAQWAQSQHLAWEMRGGH